MAQPIRPPARLKYQPVDLSDRVINPTVQVDLLSLAVPAGMEFECAGVSIVYSEPYLAITRAVGWRVYVNDSIPPYVRNLHDNWLFVNCGDLGRLYQIPTLIVPAGSTISIVVSPQVAAFADHLIINGRLVGTLYAITGEN